MQLRWQQVVHALFSARKTTQYRAAVNVIITKAIETKNSGRRIPGQRNREHVCDVIAIRSISLETRGFPFPRVPRNRWKSRASVSFPIAFESKGT